MKKSTIGICAALVGLLLLLPYETEAKGTASVSVSPSTPIITVLPDKTMTGLEVTVTARHDDPGSGCVKACLRYTEIYTDQSGFTFPGDPLANCGVGGLMGGMCTFEKTNRHFIRGLDRDSAYNLCEQQRGWGRTLYVSSTIEAEIVHEIRPLENVPVHKVSQPVTVKVQCGTPCPQLLITTDLLPDAVQGVQYSARLATSGGEGPISYRLENGILPAGLVLSRDGVISGVTGIDGTFTFSIGATDTCNRPGGQRLHVPRTFTLKVNRAPGSQPAGKTGAPKMISDRLGALEHLYCATYMPPQIATMRAGQQKQFQVDVRNCGNWAWQPGSTGINCGAAAPTGALKRVELAYHWYKEDGVTQVVWDGQRSILAREVPAGSLATVNPATVQAPPTPGRYILQWDLVDECRAWFSSKGARGYNQNVTVTQ